MPNKGLLFARRPVPGEIRTPEGEKWMSSDKFLERYRAGYALDEITTFLPRNKAAYIAAYTTVELDTPHGAL